MARRDGVTLVEVLVSIFIMGIGLLALLVLFPLGALNMAQAVRDDRAAHVASNAEAMADARSLRIDTNISPLFTNPGGSLMALPAGWGGAGYPVFVDPAGYGYGFGNVGTGSLSIPRYFPTYAAPGTVGPMQFFALKDDAVFNENGVPQQSSVGTIDRPAKYTWAYLLRPPRASSLSVVNLSVVVFSGRSSIQKAETTYQADFIAGSSSVQINYATQQLDRPALKKGGWFLDGTMTTGQQQGGLFGPDPHGQFYRVADITDTVNQLDGSPAVLVQIEGTIHQSSAAGWGQLVVIDNVIQVVDKGPGWIP